MSLWSVQPMARVGVSVSVPRNSDSVRLLACVCGRVMCEHVACDVVRTKMHGEMWSWGGRAGTHTGCRETVLPRPCTQDLPPHK